MKRYIIGLIFCLTALLPADANGLSGTSLYRMCQGNTGVDIITCQSYITGFLDGMFIGSVTGRAGNVMYCPPEKGVSAEQGQTIVQKYLSEHQGALRGDAGHLAALALIEIYPCPK